MRKFASLMGFALFTVATGTIAEVKFSDPSSGGISYEWTVTLGHQNSHDIVGSTDGKGAFEPSLEIPDIGWTLKTDWIALELEEDAILEIQVTRQEGVYELAVNSETGIKSYTTSGNMLFPSLSIYQGWDNSTDIEKEHFNPMGNFWSTINFKDAEFSQYGETTIVWRARMAAGLYTINIGGVNTLYCAVTEACYKGMHGYRATFTTSVIQNISGM